MYEIFRSNLFSLIRIAIPLMTVPILARMLDKAELGNYYAALSFSAWIFIIVEFGLSVTGSRRIASSGLDSDLFSSVIYIKAVVIFITGVIISIFAMYKNDQALVFILGWLLGSVQGITPSWIFIAMKKYSQTIFSDIITQAAFLCGVFLISKFLLHNWVYFIVLLVVLYFFQMIYLYVSIIRDKKIIAKKPQLHFIKSIFFDGRNIILNRIITSVYTALGGFVVFLVGGSIQVAYFSNSDRLVKAANPINDVTVNSAFGSLLERKDDRYLSSVFFFRILVMLMGCSTAYALFLYFASGMVVQYLFGKSYLDIIPIIKTYVLCLPIIAYSYSLGVLWFNAHGKEKYYTTSTIFAIAVVFPFCIYLLHTQGVLGYVKGICVLEFVNALAMTLIALSKKQFPSLRSSYA